MSAKIIVADDSQTIQKVIRITLANEGYDLIECTDVSGLVPVVEREAPSLILLDYNLSESKTGYDLAREIKANNSNVKIMMLFGTFDTIEEELLSEAGVSAHIVKPFDGNKFISTCRNLLQDAKLESSNNNITFTDINEAREDENASFVEEENIKLVNEISDWGVEVPPVIGSASTSASLPPVIDNEVISNEAETSSHLPSNEDLEYPSNIEVEQSDVSDISAKIDDEDELESQVYTDEEEGEDIWAADDFVMENTAPIDSGDAIEVEEEDLPMIKPHKLEQVMDDTEVLGEMINDIPDDFPKDIMEEKLDEFRPHVFQQDNFGEIESIEDIIEDSSVESFSKSAVKLDEVYIEEKISKVVERLVNEKFEKAIERIAWEIIPDLAENLIKEELEKIKNEMLGIEN